MDILVKKMAVSIGSIIIPIAALLFFTKPEVPVILNYVIPSPTPTITPTPTNTPTPTLTPTATPTPSPRPTNTPTPTKTPMPTPIIVSSGELDNWFTQYSNQYNLDRQKFWSVAVCESKLNSNSRNGDYGGLFQFASSTWRSTRSRMNADQNPDYRFQPEEAIKTAAFKISQDGYSAWANCAK